MTLDQFEAFVLNQKPASKPWEPVTDYSFEARKAIEGQHPQLILDNLTPCEDSDILDYGCGPDAHLVKLLRLEIEKRGLQMSVVGYEPQRGDAPPSKYGVFDLVICREVLEHLTVLQIRQEVANLCRLSAKYVYVTTRFAFYPKTVIDVQPCDDLDPTHISMLPKDLLRALFILEGFKRRADLEKKMDWQKKNRCLVYERAV